MVSSSFTFPSPQTTHVQGADRFIPPRPDSTQRDIAHRKVMNGPAGENDILRADRGGVDRLAVASFGLHYKDFVRAPIVDVRGTFPNLLRSGMQTLPRQRNVISTRHISSAAKRVLAAPGLSKDFYLNVLDWSTSNTIAIALGNKVNIWNRNTCRLVGEMGYNQPVTSVKFLGDGGHLLVGLQNGAIVLSSDVRTTTHAQAPSINLQRVCTIDTVAEQCFVCGSGDGVIRLFDMRVSNSVIELGGHSGAVCKVVTSPWDNNYLASGGDDDLLCLHDLRNSGNGPFRQWTHGGGVKAIDFSRSSSQFLLSGAGTGDPSIRVIDWNRGKVLQKLNTFSQVTNLFWSRCPFDRTVITTHGHNSKCVMVWHQNETGRLSPLPIARLPAHSDRLLFAAPQPNGAELAVGSANQFLLFYNVFDQTRASAGGLPETKKLKLSILDNPPLR